MMTSITIKTNRERFTDQLKISAIICRNYNVYTTISDYWDERMKERLVNKEIPPRDIKDLIIIQFQENINAWQKYTILNTLAFQIIVEELEIRVWIWEAVYNNIKNLRE